MIYNSYGFHGSRIHFKKRNIKKAIFFFVTYVSIVLMFKFLTMGNPAVMRLLSTFLIFIYFLIESKQIKKWSYVLTFSIFVSLLTECSHLFSSLILRSGMRFFYAIENIDNIISVNLVLFMSTAAFIHFCTMFLIYRFKFVKMKTVKLLSIYKSVPIFFGMCLLTIIYLKIEMKQAAFGSPFVFTMCNAILCVLPIFLTLYYFANKHVETRNAKQNYIAKDLILQWILHPPKKTKFLVNAGSDTLAFLDKYEYITSGFVKKLSKLGINDSTKGFSSLVFCLFVTSMLRGTTGWNFEDDVFEMADSLLKLPYKGSVKHEIENIIKKIWTVEEHETLRNEYYNFCFLRNYNKNSPEPNVAEFLINLSSNAQISLEEVISNKHSSSPVSRPGELMSIYGEGVIITGSSGVGKSDAALELLKQGHSLVADDIVELRRVKNSLFGNACKESKNFMEARGIGFINIKRTHGANAVKDIERVDLVVNLMSPEEFKNQDKLYDPCDQVFRYVKILGVQVPYIDIVVRPGRNAANIIEIATKNNRQRFLGFVAANELFENLGIQEENYEKSKIVNDDHLEGFDYEAFKRNCDTEEDNIYKDLREAINQKKLCFFSDKYKQEMEYFKGILRNLHMKEISSGFEELAFAAVVLKSHKNINKVRITPDVFSYMGQILGINPRSVYANLRNALERHWLNTDFKILEESYQGPIDEKNGAPIPKDFLIHIVKEAIKEKSKNNDEPANKTG